MTAPTIEAMAVRLLEDGADPESANLLAGMVLDRLQYGADGIPVVLTPQGHPAVDSAGLPVTVADFLSGLKSDIPQFWKKESQGRSTGPTLPVGFRAPPTRDEAQSATLERILGTCPNGNPYRGTGNRTAIALLERNDPARARKLRAEAIR